MTRPLARCLRIFAPALALACALAAAAQSCAPPPEMRATLRGAPSAEDFTTLGIWFAAHQQYGCAANAFGSSLQADPRQHDYPHIAFMFGSALYFDGDLNDAIPSLRQAEQLGYRDPKLHVILAAALDATAARADAEAEWRAALDFDPESTPALDALSADLLADGDNKAVIEVLDQPRLQAQRSPQQAMHLGTAFAHTAQLDRAIAVLQDALNTWPDAIDLAQQLADLLQHSGRTDEAAAVLQLARARQQASAAK